MSPARRKNGKSIRHGRKQGEKEKLNQSKYQFNPKSDLHNFNAYYCAKIIKEISEKQNDK